MSEASDKRKNISVLIVDDEPDLRDIYAYKLEIEGYTVSTADGGHEVIEMLKNKEIHIDLVLTDLMMPKGNGIELAEYSLSTNIPILIASAYIDSFKGKIPEGAMILRKPFNLDELTVCIQKAIKEKNEA
ncbi:MAG: response regulator [Oligoflexales bacterium]|nr:response regulator [Oligoflexales bacterium]